MEIGSGTLWKKIKDKLPKDNTSLEVQLYNSIEESVKKYSESNDLDKIAPTCEMIYGLWIKDKHISEDKIKEALSLVNQHYIGERNVKYWYRTFYNELIKEENINLWQHRIYPRIKARRNEKSPARQLGIKGELKSDCKAH